MPCIRVQKISHWKKGKAKQKLKIHCISSDDNNSDNNTHKPHNETNVLND